MNINAYEHYTDSMKGVGNDQIVQLANLNFDQVVQLFKDKGVKTKAELQAQQNAAATDTPATTTTDQQPHTGEL